jgi:hypothetical protein
MRGNQIRHRDKRRQSPLPVHRPEWTAAGVPPLFNSPSPRRRRSPRFKLSASLVQGFLTYQIGPQARQITFGKIGKRAKQCFRQSRNSGCRRQGTPGARCWECLAAMRQCRLEQIRCRQRYGRGCPQIEKGSSLRVCRRALVIDHQLTLAEKRDTLFVFKDPINDSCRSLL